MTRVAFVTGNKTKLASAAKELEPFKIELYQHEVPMDEIQSDSAEKIALHKAQTAYDALSAPLIVNDSVWMIPALNGFPGPYMKYMNQWLTEHDFLAMMAPQANRDIVLRETVIYIDENGPQIFTEDYTGTIVLEPKGSGRNLPAEKIISLHPNKTTTIAEEFDESQLHSGHAGNIWRLFGEWYNNK